MSGVSPSGGRYCDTCGRDTAPTGAPIACCSRCTEPYPPPRSVTPSSSSPARDETPCPFCSAVLGVPHEIGCKRGRWMRLARGAGRTLARLDGRQGIRKLADELHAQATQAHARCRLAEYQLGTIRK